MHTLVVGASLSHGLQEPRPVLFGAADRLMDIIVLSLQASVDGLFQLLREPADLLLGEHRLVG